MRVRLALALCAIAVPQVAEAGIGGTFDLGIGGGATHLRGEEDSKTFGVSAAPYMSIGIKLSRQLGVAARVAMLNNDDNGTFLQFGPIVQYWLTDRLFVAGGVGLAAYYLPDPIMIHGEMVEGYGGFGIDARVGYALAGTHHRWTLSLESTPAFFQDNTSVGFALVGAYQYW